MTPPQGGLPADLAATACDAATGPDGAGRHSLGEKDTGENVSVESATGETVAGRAGSERRLHHATAIVVAGRAALIRGPSGAGKSDLALRCLALAPGPLVVETPQLLADDQVWLHRSGCRLLVSAPPTLIGRLEVRGVGILSVPAWTGEAEVALVADLDSAARPERLPDPWATVEVMGVAVPWLVLDPAPASAALRLVLALAHCGISATSA